MPASNRNFLRLTSVLQTQSFQTLSRFVLVVNPFTYSYLPSFNVTPSDPVFHPVTYPFVHAPLHSPLYLLTYPFIHSQPVSHPLTHVLFVYSPLTDTLTRLVMLAQPLTGPSARDIHSFSRTLIGFIELHGVGQGDYQHASKMRVK